jgi:hypothetical protein
MSGTVRYQLRTDDAPSGWLTVTRALPIRKDGKENGWLHWEIRTKHSTETGLAKPGTWRVKP